MKALLDEKYHCNHNGVVMINGTQRYCYCPDIPKYRWVDFTTKEVYTTYCYERPRLDPLWTKIVQNESVKVI